MGRTPNLINDGAPTMATIIYDAETGTPIPIRRQTTPVSNSVIKREPCDKSIIAQLTFNPIPVIVITPTTIPAQAQATATPTAVFAPVSNVEKKALGKIRGIIERKFA